MGSTCECNVFELDNEVIIDLFQIYDQCMRIHVCVNNNPTKNLTRDLEWWTHVCARSLRVVSTKNVLTASLASTPTQARATAAMIMHMHTTSIYVKIHTQMRTRVFTGWSAPCVMGPQASTLNTPWSVTQSPNINIDIRIGI